MKTIIPESSSAFLLNHARSGCRCTTAMKCRSTIIPNVPIHRKTNTMRPARSIHSARRRHKELIGMKNDFSRREFLQTGAVAAGGLLAAKTILLDPDPALALNNPVPPSDRVRFGMIGIGMQGSGLLTSAITLPGVECVAAADLYDGRHTLAKEIVRPDLPVTRRYQELLADKNIDCIVAAVPDHWHKQVVVDAVSAGKDIYCEKPMSHTAAEGVEMVAAAKRTGRIVQIGSQRVSSAMCA